MKRNSLLIQRFLPPKMDVNSFTALIERTVQDHTTRQYKGAKISSRTKQLCAELYEILTPHLRHDEDL